MEIYGRVRRAVWVEGKSERTVAREFGIARETVRKMLRYAVPPGYRREQPVKRPKLGPWINVIDAILEEDKNNSTVSGLTRMRARFHPDQNLRAETQKSLLSDARLGLGCLRFNAPSC